MELKRFQIFQPAKKSILLIVPYGIETDICTEPVSGHDAFNRTLWNWNFAPASIPGSLSELLIVPYGIETCIFSTISPVSAFF